MEALGLWARLHADLILQDAAKNGELPQCLLPTASQGIQAHQACVPFLVGWISINEALERRNGRTEIAAALLDYRELQKKLQELLMESFAPRQGPLGVAVLREKIPRVELERPLVGSGLPALPSGSRGGLKRLHVYPERSF